MLANLNKFLRLSRFQQGNKIFGAASALTVPLSLFAAAFSWNLTVFIFVILSITFAYIKYNISHANQR
jgi:membrane protein implicated in regulation of membrane protease activity